MSLKTVNKPHYKTLECITEIQVWLYFQMLSGSLKALFLEFDKKYDKTVLLINWWRVKSIPFPKN